MVKDSADDDGDDDDDDEDDDNDNDNGNDNNNAKYLCFSLEPHNCTSIIMLRLTSF